MVKETLVAEQEQEEYVLDGIKTYCLYDNEQQDTLLAMAYEEKEIKEESKFYAEGVWFEYDNIQDTNGMTNERKYKKKVKFPKEPETRPSYLEMQESYNFSSKVGDIR